MAVNAIKDTAEDNNQHSVIQDKGKLNATQCSSIQFCDNNKVATVICTCSPGSSCLYIAFRYLWKSIQLLHQAQSLLFRQTPHPSADCLLPPLLMGKLKHMQHQLQAQVLAVQCGDIGTLICFCKFTFDYYSDPKTMPNHGHWIRCMHIDSRKQFLKLSRQRSSQHFNSK